MKPSGRSSAARRRRRRSNLGGRSRTVETFNHPNLESQGTESRGVEKNYYGAFLAPKHKNSFRFALHNVHGLPIYSSYQEENKEIFQALVMLEADVFAGTEINVHWRMLAEDDRLYTRTQTWFQALHLSLAYNVTQYPPSPSQYGGVGIFSINKACHRVLTRGQDPSNLGRWAWTRYRGKDGLALRIVTAYCPHDRGGDLSVYGQHRHHFHVLGKPRIPRQAFWEDLLQALQQWLAAGDQLIVSGDWNEDVNDVQRKYFEPIGLREVLLEKFGDAPNTFEFGSKPIDGIFMSSTLSIQQGGYLPFGEGIDSDHRVAWVDLSYTTAFGHNSPPLSRPIARRLTCKHPIIRDRFIAAYEAFIVQHKLHEKTHALLARASYPLSEYDQRMFEWIDQMRLIGIQQAEKRCRKLRMGDVVFSPSVMKWWKSIETWKLLIKKAQGKRVSSRRLTRTIAKAELDDDLTIYSLSVPQCQENLDRAKFKYREAKNEATTRRETWLDELAGAVAAQGNTKKATILERLKRDEAQRRTFRKLKYLRGRLRGGGVAFLQTTGADGSIQDVTDKREMERLLLRANENKFRQCEQTPMMQQPLLAEFGRLGVDMPAARQVMEGTYDAPPGTHPAAQYVLQNLAMSDIARDADDTNQSISVDQWMKFWKTARENTSSGPSAMHFGVLKAGAHSVLLASLDCWMTEIPRRSGYSPVRWRSAIDAVLWKKPGVFTVESTRTIVLFEPDFNYLNKHNGRLAMINAELFNHLAMEQYGSRKDHRSIDQGTNKRLTTDMFLLRREPGALCSNDATGCYDRIQLAFAALALLRQRLDESGIVCMIQTLLFLYHQVRTIYGESDERYGGTATNQPSIQGCGQGNGAGPQMFATISSALVELLRKAGFGAEFVTAISHRIIKYIGFLFVDDTDQVQSARFKGETLASIAAKLQDAVDMWENGLWVSGGALAPAKSHWYAIDFRWKDGKCRLATKEETTFSIYMRDSKTGLRVEIDRLDPDEARTTLGVNLCPSGSMVSQKQRMIAVTTKWASQMQAGVIKKHEMWISVTMMLWKTLEYPLPATTLTLEECDEIMAPAKVQILHGLQICSNFPLVLLFGPKSKLGVGLPHLYSLQGILHIEDLLHHTSQGTLTGELYRSTLEQLIINIGYGSDLFAAPFAKLGALMPYTWMTHLWEFLDRYGLRIQHDIELPLLRHHDSFIMRQAVDAKFSPSQLDAINRCRLYLQVLTVAELATADGESLTDKAWNGIRDTSITSPYIWPVQPSPPLRDWRLWQAALSVCFLARGLRLQVPLGDWLGNDFQWEWFYSPSENRLYQRTSSGWIFWIQRSTVRRTPQPLFIRQQLLSARPGRCYRARTEPWGNFTRLLSASTTYSNSRPPPSAVSDKPLLQVIRALPSSQQWSLQRCLSSHEYGQDIVHAIENGTAIAVSDGSFKDSFGTAAWTIRGDSDDQFLTGVNVVPGVATDQSAFRSELAGLYGIIMAITTICTSRNILHGCVTVACDGEAALEYIFDWGTKFLKSSTPHLDLIAAGRKLIQQSPLQWKFRHVKGHQDDFVGPLDRWATLNVEMDMLAKAHWARSVTLGRSSSSIHCEPWSVWYQQVKLVSPIRDTIYEIIHGPPLDAYWLSRKRFLLASLPFYDWEALEDATRPLPLTRRLWLTKHLSGWCSVGRMAQRWKLRSSAVCPRCPVVENARHVWGCKDPRAISRFDQSVDHLQVQLGRQFTSPVVCNIICRRLRDNQ